ncbi:hypothetical protein ACIP4Y_07215 [Streptomyces sp. NPDC088810]|uniref:hypothetical protein n=1 Tax=Streptomyces sp. NPDC088810 TaxID=3365904 RepID=UPI0037F15128
MSDMLWIPVPGGFVQDRPLLRVLVVPRLDGGTPAQHGMAQWPPAALTAGTVRVELFRPGAGPSAAPDGSRDLVPAVPFQAGVWERLVAGLPVEDAPDGQRAVDPGRLTVRETSKDAQAVAQGLQDVARAEVDPELGPRSPDFTQRVQRVLRSEHWLAPEEPAPAPVDVPASPGRPGFHRTLSLLREHPAVLRALGLIFELALDPRDVTDHAGGTVRVVWPARPASLPAVVSPRTLFEAGFRPGSTARVDDGMVTLDRTDDHGAPLWQVATVDVDVAAQRLREAARAHDADPAAGTPVLPALRSDGLRLVLRGRGQEMSARLSRAARAALPDVLTADDLVLGYRIDVRPTLGGAHWFSLHRRNATYRAHRRLPDGRLSEDFLVIGAAGAPEEGHLKTNAAISDWTGLHADETVAAWRGWSLAVPRPQVDGTPAAQPPADPGLSLSTAFEVEPGTLPPLRFGRHYTLRARVADLAGGGLGPGDDAAEQHGTRPEFYARHEPLPAPVVVYPAAVDPARVPPGESAELVVIRSDPVADLDVPAYAGRHGYPLNDQRLLRPPDGTPALAEQHGMLDLDGDPAVVNRVTWEWVGRALLAAAEGPALPDPAAGGIAVLRTEPRPPALLARAWEAPDKWPGLPPRTLQLTTPQPGRPAVAWEGDRLVVRLAPTQQLTLEVSTFPREGITDHFALHLADPPENATKAFGQGRHPMVTPARSVTLVHAVQHPLRRPDTVLKAGRAANATFATLVPQSDVFDPKSTAELHVTARWTDQWDTRRQEVTDVPVETIPVDPSGPARPETLFRHEFGDTRHRTVTYTLKAVGRFREYFRDPQLTDEFTLAEELAPVSVPSSARPAPPVVLSARPAFRWQRTGDLAATGHTLTRERSAGRVRLALQPPWHTTGAGELLAVVVRPEGAGPDDRLSPFVSLAGSDPVYPTKGLPLGAPFAAHISSATAPDRRLALEEAHADVVVKPHQPEYQEDEGCWLCDVALAGTDGTAFHHALVQLAVARYQPESLAGLALSPVVRTDTVPLLPDRTLQVTRLAADRVQVKLTGVISPAPAVDRVDMVLERCRAPEGVPADQVDLIAFDASPTGVPAWYRVDLRKPVPKKVGLSRVREWTSEFWLPQGTGALRVRVREVEFIPNDEPREGAFLHTSTPEEIKERTVFADTVLLPGL